MRHPIIACALAMLLLTLAMVYRAGTVAGQEQRQSWATRAAQSRPSEITAIEAYCKGLDQYLKNNPQATRYFVDALPEEDAASPTERGKVWHEVKTEEEMLEAERSYANRSIVVSVKDGAIVYADIAEPMEHHRYDDKYYFRPDGTLVKIESEFYGNMAERHLVRERFYHPDGKVLRSTSQCFRIINTSRGSREKPISCRLDAASAEYGRHPLPVYKRSTNLPGYELLKKNADH